MKAKKKKTTKIKTKKRKEFEEVKKSLNAVQCMIERHGVYCFVQTCKNYANPPL